MWIVEAIAAGIIIAGTALFFRYFRYRFRSMVRFGETPDMLPRSPEGYTDKLFYRLGETVTFFLRSDAERNTLSIRRMTGPFEFEELSSTTFSEQEQSIPSNASEYGCDWTPSVRVTLDKKYVQGYYQAVLKDETGNDFEIYFIIGESAPSKIVIIAPVSTWTAYNGWGGKSLYQNKFKNKTNYFVSTQRPNTAFQTNHDIQVEANIFNWFSNTYDDVTIIPDYALEQPGVLKNCELLILAYHNEYFSEGMHAAIRDALARGISVIALGANQLYWIVRWNDPHTRMECRKDLTFFEGTASYGGMWKHHFHPPQRYVHGRYNALGMHTFAPYQLVAPKTHWLLEGTNIEPGELFGRTGVGGKPISGAETDKTSAEKHTEIIAHGMNGASESTGTIYDADNRIWDGSGGGDMTFTLLSNGAGVLNTASIQSGGGLGIDPVFTKIVENFVKRFGPKKLR